MALDRAVDVECEEAIANAEAGEQASPPPNLQELETRLGMHRVVWLLAWPSVITMLLQTLNSFIDRGFVGRLGADALAAVGVGGQLMFVVFSIGMSISIGATALVARFTGMGENEDAKIAANQSLWIAGMASLVCVAIMWPLRHPLVSMLHVNPHAAYLCVTYITITLLSMPALFVMLIMGGVYRGIGDMVTPLFVMIGVNIIHLGGDFLLIFGMFGFPKLGLTGGAIALAASQVIGAILYLLFLQRSRLAGLFRTKSRLEIEWARRILNIGIPAAMQNLSRILSMLAFTGILTRTPEGTAAAAALTIGLTSESIAFMPGFAFSTAASTLTGQNLGAGNPKRAEQAAWTALLQGLLVMTVMGVVFYVFALPIVHLFTHDSHVGPLAVDYLQISALSEPFLAFGMILTGALNGAGDTKAPAWASAITMWGIRLPLAYAAAHVWGFGTIGAWWAMMVSTTAGGFAAYGLFKWGRWKKTEV